MANPNPGVVTQRQAEADQSAQLKQDRALRAQRIRKMLDEGLPAYVINSRMGLAKSTSFVQLRRMAEAE